MGCRCWNGKHIAESLDAAQASQRSRESRLGGLARLGIAATIQPASPWRRRAASANAPERLAASWSTSSRPSTPAARTRTPVGHPLRYPRAPSRLRPPTSGRALLPSSQRDHRKRRRACVPTIAPEGFSSRGRHRGCRPHARTSLRCGGEAVLDWKSRSHGWDRQGESRVSSSVAMPSHVHAPGATSGVPDIVAARLVPGWGGKL